MQSLSLSGNWLAVENIQLLVSKLPNLLELSLDQSGLATLPPGIFYNNLQLKELNISGNYLIHLDASIISDLDMLEVLDLSYNYFMGPDQTFFDVIKQKEKSGRLKMLYLQGNQFVCDKCHITPLYNWLKSSLKYWGTCFSSSSDDLCLRCSQPNEYLHMAIEDLHLQSLPECQEVKQAIPYNDIPNTDWESMRKQKSNVSTYLAAGIGSLVLLVILSILLIRYFGPTL